MIGLRLTGVVCACFIGCVPPSTHAVAVSGQGIWETTLQGRDLDGDISTIEAYYNTEQNITWLVDANYSRTSGYHSSGYMNWADANGWAADLNYHGITGWRLPSVTDVDNDGWTWTSIYKGIESGYNFDTANGEMGYMFYAILGNSAYYDTNGITTGCTSPNYCLCNTGPFSNLSSSIYWSSVGVEPYPDYAWMFNFTSGIQSYTDRT